MADPWAVLGLGPGSSLDEARAARRRLAKELHPDLHAARPVAERAELARRMTEVNLAIAELEATAPLSGEGRDGGRGEGSGDGRWGPAPPPDVRTGRRGPDHERPCPLAAVLSAESFTVDALPVEAFEAIFLAGYDLGEILVADEPYALELYLPGPPPCFCRLVLEPEAGSSMVTLELTPAEGVDPPDVQAVRDLVVSGLNELAGSTRP